MNKGTLEGTHQEIDLVRSINKGSYKEYFKTIFPNCTNIYGVRVSGHKFSKLSEKLVKPKSDAFLICTTKTIEKFLLTKQFYLEEEDIQDIIKVYDECFKIRDSGISIKRKDSKSYQIHKFSPKSFVKVFNNKYLGAGAMIYSKDEKDFNNNKQIIENWGITEHEFLAYFDKKYDIINKNMTEQDKFKKINKECLSEIKETIIKTENIKKSIFTGKNDFEEPYGATFSFINNKLENFKYTDFYVTQGSGRLRKPTIVIKPKS